MNYTILMLSSFLFAGIAAAETTPPPVIEPLGQVVDRTVPAYQPKFLKIQPIGGRYDERRWAYFNTYPACPFWGFGTGGYFFGYGSFGGSFSGASIQNNTSYSR